MERDEVVVMVFMQLSFSYYLSRIFNLNTKLLTQFTSKSKSFHYLSLSMASFS